MELTLGELMIDDIADIVDRGVGDDLGGARLGIDLDLGDMCAAWESARRRHFGDGVERMCRASGMAQHDLLQRDSLIRAFDRVAPALELDIERRGFECFGGKRQTLLHDLVRRDLEAAARSHAGA